MSAVDREIDAFLRHLRIERGLSANTVRSYRSDLRSYADWLAERDAVDLTALTERDLGEYPRWLADHRAEAGLPTAATTTGRMLSAVRSLHRYLFLDGRTPRDPAIVLRAPKKPSRLPKALTVDEVSGLLGAVDGSDPESVRDRAILEFLYATGARVSELCDALVDDVQRVERADADMIDVVRLRGKGGKQRIVPFGSYARAALDAYLVRVRPALAERGHGGAHLFLGVRGGRLSRQAVWTIIKRAAARVDLEHRVSPHVLRHSFATHLLAGGADIRIVQELLGHASVTTTQVYTRVTQEHLRQVYATSHPRAHR
ncbi:site-specific tyrosine recombinase XerD [Pseudoclavibacter sp. 13-3]|uniref:site-specific tyrosine recombinase XerD n=1 Tax=Pseudoclavibacter sp. 13-3 TaxID=2901228 RepID=UPI001E2AC61F|nr:site-specific tyrosine recombinase XerD [Pseudoclavibacter sp. 13-3]